MSVNAEDLRKIREGVKAPSGTGAARSPKARKRPPQVHPFALIPLHWLPILRRCRAVAALPLLAAIAYEMQMEGRSRVPITSDTWAKAGGYFSEAQRHAMLNVVQRAPSIVLLKLSQRTGTKYAAHRGVWFDNAPPRVAEEGDDDVAA
jgi:hypothetical protein